ncbi:MAG TPA: serine hydrolase domain-containing protein, partial [Steroidobacteraceae bacterium]|nr:serine hydrolase domain-containing protein [Steroidobacteraceae bacterium]
GARRDGAMLHASGHGLADIAAGQKLSEQSVFNIASISKQFTAFSILLLDERKALSIDDPLTKYVPELAASANGVTLRRLLHHMGGLRDYEGLLMLRGRRYVDGATQAETIRALARQRGANFPAGTKYVYSNSGYVLLGTVVERVSGQSMKQFATQNIFIPLGMTHTTIVDRYPADIPALARGYAPAKQGFDIDESAWEQVGDGQVHTTVGDLLLWTDNYRSGRVGGPALVKRMTEVGVLASGEKIEYAAGLVVGELHGLRMIGHGGAWAGYRSNLLMFPEQQFAVAVFCNRGDVNPGKLSRSVAEIFLADEMRRTGKRTPDDEPYDDKPPKAEWKPKNLAAYEGVYVSDEAEARCLLVQRDGALVLEGCAPGVKLQPSARGEFFAPDRQVRLRFGESGKPSGFTLHAYALDGLAFTRQ